MMIKGMIALLLMHSVGLYANRAYVTDVFGGQVFVDTNGVMELVLVAGSAPHFVSPSYVSTSPEGRLAYVNDYGFGSASVYSIDTETNLAYPITNATSTPFSGTFSSAFSPTEQKAYVGGGGMIYVIDTTTNTATGTVAIAGGLPGIGSVFGIVFSNDGSFAYATSFGNGVYVIDTSTDTAISLITHALGVPAFLSADSVAINPKNSAQAYVADNAVPAIFIIDNATKQAIGTVSLAAGVPSFVSPYDVVFSRNGELAYVADNGVPGVFVIDTALNEATQLVTHDSGVPSFSTPLGVAFSADGLFALVTDVAQNGVFYVNTASSTATAFIESPGSTGTQGVAFIPAPLSPAGLSCVQKKNDFGLSHTLHNILNWGPSSSRTASYNVYRDGVLIRSFNGLTHVDRNAAKETRHYRVTATDVFGIESDPVTVLLQ